MEFNARFMLVLVVLAVSVVRTSAVCQFNASRMVDEASVADCTRAVWFDEKTGMCVKVDPSKAKKYNGLGVLTLVADSLECTVFYLIIFRKNLFFAFKVGTVFKSLDFNRWGIKLTDDIQLIDRFNDDGFVEARDENLMTPLTFKYSDLCYCLLNDGSIGFTTFEPKEANNGSCGNTDRCLNRWSFRKVCGAPPDVQNGDKAVDCIYEGCTTTYVCHDQYEIEGDAVSQCVDGEWSPRPTCATTSFNCMNRNPCSTENTEANGFYFLHDEKSKFVQCSEWEQCYEMDCPAGLEFDKEGNVCSRP